jgi:hypothetical protein
VNPKEAEERLFDYVADRLGPVHRDEVRDILERDPALSRTAANLAFARNRLVLLDGLADLDAAILEEAPPEPAKSARPEDAGSAPEAKKQPPWPVFAAGLLVVVVGIGALILLSGPSGPRAEKKERPKVRASVPPKTDRPSRPVRQPEDDVRPSPPEERPDRPVRPTAVKPGVEMLLPRYMKSPSQAVLERVWEALSEKPSGAAGIRLRIGSLPDGKNKVLLVLALAAANDDFEVRNLLATLLRTASSPDLRRAAAGSLGHVPGKESVAVAATDRLSVKAGRIDEPERRRILLDAAAAERDPEVLGTLVRLVAPSRELDESIGDRLFELARSENADLRRAAIDGLRSGKSDDVRVLKTLIADTAIPARERALLVPAAVDGLPFLQNLIDGSSELEIRVAAAGALSKLPYKGVRDVEAGIFENPDYPREVRLAALNSLAASSQARAKQLATKAAESDADEEIQKAAKELLRAWNPKPAEGEQEGR